MSEIYVLCLTQYFHYTCIYNKTLRCKCFISESIGRKIIKKILLKFFAIRFFAAINTQIKCVTHITIYVGVRMFPIRDGRTIYTQSNEFLKNVITICINGISFTLFPNGLRVIAMRKKFNFENKAEKFNCTEKLT